MGIGKANAVPDAMRKASERARKNIRVVNLAGTTIPHESLGQVGGARVFLKPASPGTGVIAAGGVRAVLEVAGVRDILTKSMGSANVLNVVMATFDALFTLEIRPDRSARAAARRWKSCCRSGNGGNSMPKKESTGKTIRVTLVRSPIGFTKDQKATVLALGLHRMHETVEHKDTPALRGMLTKIIHLLKIEE